MNEEIQPHRLLIDSRAAYLEGADTLYAMAKRALCIFDPDLEMLGLNTPGRIERLQAFLQISPENILRMAVHEPGNILRGSPRLVELLRKFTPRVLIYRTDGVARRAQDRFILVDAQHFVRRAVADQARGVFALHEPSEGRQLQERFEDIWAVSAEAVAATTLGL